jgi:hypothetical protein
LLLATGLAFGGLIAPRSLLELERADLVVVGSAGGDIQAGATSGSFALRVSRVVSGDSALAGQTIPVSWASADGLLTGGFVRAGSHVPMRGTGLWFLQRSSNGWLLLPVMAGGISQRDIFFPASLEPVPIAYSYAAAASPSDKIASELAAAIEADKTHNFQLSMLNSMLDELKSPVLEVFYRRMSASASTEHRILGLSGLIRGGSATALSSAALAASEFQEHPLEFGTLLNSIQNEFRAADANSIAVLGRIASDAANPSLKFREAAAHALASIHTRETLPYLATLLDDPDATLRIEAIGGLGSFANGTPMQTTANTPSLASLQLTGDGTYRTAETIANFARGADAIERNEAAYLTFWTGWWASNRASLGY